MSNVGHISSMANSINTSNQLITTINYLDSEDNAVSVSSTPIQLPSGGSGGGSTRHSVRVVRKEGSIVGDNDYYVEGTSQIIQQDEYYIVNPVAGILTDIPDAEAGKFAIKASDNTITYSAPNNGDMVLVYADRQIDITDSDGNVTTTNENRIVATIIYEGDKWIVINSRFKNVNGVTEGGSFANAEGDGTSAAGDNSHAEGSSTNANGDDSHAEGSHTTAGSISSHAEGRFTTTTRFAQGAHAEGDSTTAGETAAHAEGKSTNASGQASHAEGTSTSASDRSSHAEGSFTKASGESAHAEGSRTEASGQSSHAEGESTLASGENSHAQGEETTVNNDNATIMGRNGVVGDNSTVVGVAWGSSAPFSSNKTADRDLNLIWKVDQSGNTSQTGNMVAIGHVRAGSYLNRSGNTLSVIPRYTEIDNISSAVQLTSSWQAIALKSGTNILNYDELYFRFTPAVAAEGKIEYRIRPSELHTATAAAPAGIGGIGYGGTPETYSPAIQGYYDVPTSTLYLRRYDTNTGNNWSGSPNILNAMGILGKSYTIG